MAAVYNMGKGERDKDGFILSTNPQIETEFSNKPTLNISLNSIGIGISQEVDDVLLCSKLV